MDPTPLRFRAGSRACSEDCDHLLNLSPQSQLPVSRGRRPRRLANARIRAKSVRYSWHGRFSWSPTPAFRSSRNAREEDYSRDSRKHPEFFRVAVAKGDKDVSVSLVARHVTPKDEAQGQRILPTAFIRLLMQTAIDLHDREVRAAERWHYLIPSVVGGIITGFFTVAAVVAAVWLKK